MEKELDEEPSGRPGVDKKQTVHGQLLQLYSDVKKVEKGVEEIEERVYRSCDKGSTSQHDTLAVIVDTHYNSLKWIERSISDLNKKLTDLKGLE